MSFETNFRWAAQFTPAVQRILAPHIIVQATPEMDMRHATDLWTLHVRNGIQIACRVRSFGYIDSFGFDFTVRCALPNGSKTEYQKFLEGHGHWMFYGHQVARDSSEIDPWFILNLHNLRHHWITDECVGNRRQFRNEEDGTEGFAYDVRKFPPEPSILVASSFRVPNDYGNPWVWRNPGAYIRREREQRELPLFQ